MSSPQSPSLTSEPSWVTKSTATKTSSSTLTRINPRLQRLADNLAQAQELLYGASEQNPALPESYHTTRSSPLPEDAATAQRQSQEDVLILENGVPRFISGRHWAWMAEEGRIIQITHASRKSIRASSQGALEEAQVLSELQILLKTGEAMAAEQEKALDNLVQYCDKRVSLQPMALQLSAHLKAKFWVIFWIQISRQDREKIISPVMRRRELVYHRLNKDREPFQWHISSHAGLYPILYVLSELRSPAFQTSEWADLRQRGLQVANAIHEIRGQHTTGAWPVIIWLIDRIRSQNLCPAEVNRIASLTPGPQDHPMLRSGPDSMGSTGTELDTGDFLGFMNLGDFDFPELAGC
ncbi:hypothetical protein CDV55_101864 [Aspergillus turcosus]|nr:hypothetical protein CDV55_101864 [Aspergillus turcosus]